MKDWTGNSKSVFVCNGASNHTEERQVDDYYATEPKALELLLEREKFKDNVWECACGGGHLSEVLKLKGYMVVSSDIVDRGYRGTRVIDFLEYSEMNSWDIITNPPYKYAKEFIEHALNISVEGTKIAMFLKLTFLESKSRKGLFENTHLKHSMYLLQGCSVLKTGNLKSIKRMGRQLLMDGMCG